MSNSQKQVYFMRPVGMVGPIKIGCSKFLDQRLFNLASWSPYPLEIILSFPGSHKLEHNIHQCFADLHSHKEWFHPGKRLLDAIEAMKAGTPAEDVIDLNAKVGTIIRKPIVPPGCEKRRSYSARIRWARSKLPRHLTLPDWIREVMNGWSPYGSEQPRIPTSDELAKIDAFLADPPAHADPCPYWKGKIVDRRPDLVRTAA